MYRCGACGRRFKLRNSLWWSIVSGVFIGVGGGGGALLINRAVGERFSVIAIFTLTAIVLFPFVIAFARALDSVYEWEELDS